MTPDPSTPDPLTPDVELAKLDPLLPDQPPADDAAHKAKVEAEAEEEAAKLGDFA